MKSVGKHFLSCFFIFILILEYRALVLFVCTIVSNMPVHYIFTLETYLSHNIKCHAVNIEEVAHTKHRGTYSAHNHPETEKIPQWHSFANISTAKNKNLAMESHAQSFSTHLKNIDIA